MLPDPLHPAIVHLPVALALLLPLLALVAAVLMWRGVKPVAAWAPVVTTAVVLLLGAWLAVETGEDQGERVEGVVGEAAVEAHEELAETIPIAAAVTLALAGLGLLPGRAGVASRLVAGLAMVVLAGMTIQVGHTGGQLVYRHGAASVYATAAVSVTAAAPSTVGLRPNDED